MVNPKDVKKWVTAGMAVSAILAGLSSCGAFEASSLLPKLLVGTYLAEQVRHVLPSTSKLGCK